MFDNLGDKLKILAIIVTVLGLIGSVIIGVTWSKSEDKYGDPSTNFEMGLLGFLVGTISTCISSWGIYALGEAADCRVKIDQLMVDMSEIKIKLKQAQDSK